MTKTARLNIVLLFVLLTTAYRQLFSVRNYRVSNLSSAALSKVACDPVAVSLFEEEEDENSSKAQISNKNTMMTIQQQQHQQEQGGFSSSLSPFVESNAQILKTHAFAVHWTLSAVRNDFVYLDHCNLSALTNEDWLALDFLVHVLIAQVRDAFMDPRLAKKKRLQFSAFPVTWTAEVAWQALELYAVAATTAVTSRQGTQQPPLPSAPAPAPSAPICNFTYYQFSVPRPAILRDNVEQKVAHIPKHNNNNNNNNNNSGHQVTTARIVYCISAFKDIESLTELVQVLHLPQHLIVIHLDRWTLPEFTQKVRDLATKFSNVVVLQFGSIIYPTDSLTHVFLQIMRWVTLELQFDYHYWINLGANAFPLFPAELLAQALLVAPPPPMANPQHRQHQPPRRVRMGRIQMKQDKGLGDAQSYCQDKALTRGLTLTNTPPDDVLGQPKGLPQPPFASNFDKYQHRYGSRIRILETHVTRLFHAVNRTFFFQKYLRLYKANNNDKDRLISLFGGAGAVSDANPNASGTDWFFRQQSQLPALFQDAMAAFRPPPELQKHCRIKVVSGNTAALDVAAVRAMLKSPDVMEYFAHFKFHGSCCAEEYHWGAALSMINRTMDLFEMPAAMWQAWPCEGAMSNAILPPFNINSTNCLHWTVGSKWYKANGKAEIQKELIRGKLKHGNLFARKFAHGNSTVDEWKRWIQTDVFPLHPPGPLATTIMTTTMTTSSIL